MPLAPSSFLLLVVRPGAPSSVLAPSSDALGRTHLRDFGAQTRRLVGSVPLRNRSTRVTFRRRQPGIKKEFLLKEAARGSWPYHLFHPFSFFLCFF